MAGRKHFFNFLALVILAYIVISAEAQCTADGTKCQFSCGKDRLLPSCAVGFGAGVTGGAAGPTYFVTDSSDDADYNNPKPGTIRHALRQASQSPWGLWIKFSYSMEIALTQNLFMVSNTTIDGRDAYVTITGWTLVVEGVKNVILHNFAVANVPESDTVHILSGSSLIWVDHISSWNSELGLVSVVQGSTDVTISNCHLSNHNFNMLLGASDGDKIDENMRVTVYRNFFDYSNQRMPHCRWGYCHVLNNYYKNWGFYTVGGRVYAKLYTEMNVFQPGKVLEVTPYFRGFNDDATATIESHNNLFLNGATFTWFNHTPLAPPPYVKATDYPPLVPTSVLPTLVQNCAGTLFWPQLGICLNTN